MHSPKQRRSLNAYGRNALMASLPPGAKAEMNEAIRGGVLLTPPAKKNLVRNQVTGRVLPCCFEDCWEDGNNMIRVEAPHEDPRFEGEKVVYIFCSETHKGYWIAKLLAQR